MNQLLPSQIKNIKELQKLVTKNTIKRIRINKITKKKYTGKVYDLQVSATNTYQLNGVFSSNSAGGSLVCYLLGISNYDPMKWDLSFDRFLSSSRGGYLLKVTMPEK